MNQITKPNFQDGATDEDGEPIYLNKVEQSLQMAGVALRNAQGEFRDMGEVLDELGSKWKNLDRNTKAYLSTTIAGSRQSVRLIAALDNYDKVLKLTNVSQNSAGELLAQYAVYSDSVEASLGRTKAAYEQFLTTLSSKGIITAMSHILKLALNISSAIGAWPIALGTGYAINQFAKQKTAQKAFDTILNQRTLQNDNFLTANSGRSVADQQLAYHQQGAKALNDLTKHRVITEQEAYKIMQKQNLELKKAATAEERLMRYSIMQNEQGQKRIIVRKYETIEQMKQAMQEEKQIIKAQQRAITEQKIVQSKAMQFALNKKLITSDQAKAIAGATAGAGAGLSAAGQAAGGFLGSIAGGASKAAAAVKSFAVPLVKLVAIFWVINKVMQVLADKLRFIKDGFLIVGDAIRNFAQNFEIFGVRPFKVFGDILQAIFPWLDKNTNQIKELVKEVAKLDSARNSVADLVKQFQELSDKVNKTSADMRQMDEIRNQLMLQVSKLQEGGEFENIQYNQLFKVEADGTFKLGSEEQILRFLESIDKNVEVRKKEMNALQKENLYKEFGKYDSVTGFFTYKDDHVARKEHMISRGKDYEERNEKYMELKRLILDLAPQRIDATIEANKGVNEIPKQLVEVLKVQFAQSLSTSLTETSTKEELMRQENEVAKRFEMAARQIAQADLSDWEKQLAKLNQPYDLKEPYMRQEIQTAADEFLQWAEQKFGPDITALIADSFDIKDIVDNKLKEAIDSFQTMEQFSTEMKNGYKQIEEFGAKAMDMQYKIATKTMAPSDFFDMLENPSFLKALSTSNYDITFDNGEDLLAVLNNQIELQQEMLKQKVEELELSKANLKVEHARLALEQRELQDKLSHTLDPTQRGELISAIKATKDLSQVIESAVKNIDNQQNVLGKIDLNALANLSKNYYAEQSSKTKDSLTNKYNALTEIENQLRSNKIEDFTKAAQGVKGDPELYSILVELQNSNRAYQMQNGVPISFTPEAIERFSQAISEQKNRLDLSYRNVSKVPFFGENQIVTTQEDLAKATDHLRKIMTEDPTLADLLGPNVEREFSDIMKQSGTTFSNAIVEILKRRMDELSFNTRNTVGIPPAYSDKPLHDRISSVEKFLAGEQQKKMFEDITKSTVQSMMNVGSIATNKPQKTVVEILQEKKEGLVAKPEIVEPDIISQNIEKYKREQLEQAIKDNQALANAAVEASYKAMPSIGIEDDPAVVAAKMAESGKLSEKDIRQIDLTKLALDRLNNALERQSYLSEKYEKGSKAYRDALSAELRLLLEKQGILDKQNKTINSTFSEQEMRLLQGKLGTSGFFSLDSSGNPLFTQFKRQPEKFMEYGSNQGLGNIAPKHGPSKLGYTGYNLPGAHLSYTRPNEVTAEQLERLIRKLSPNSPFTGEMFWKASQATGLNALDLLAQAAHESAWGTSQIARTKNNLFGIGAFDASPQKSAWTFKSLEDGLMEGAKFIKRDYVEKGQASFWGLVGGQKQYATDKDYATKLTNMRENFYKHLNIQPQSVEIQTTNTELNAQNAEMPAHPLGGKGTITGRFGDSRDGGKRKHEGVDYAADAGTPILSTTNGKVVSTAPNKLGGNTITIQDDQGQRHYYAHMLEQTVLKVGDIVKKGQQIGKVGNTGHSFGAHLHYGIYDSQGVAINPEPFLKTAQAIQTSVGGISSGVGDAIDQYNKYVDDLEQRFQDILSNERDLQSNLKTIVELQSKILEDHATQLEREAQAIRSRNNLLQISASFMDKETRYYRQNIEQQIKNRSEERGLLQQRISQYQSMIDLHEEMMKKDPLTALFSGEQITGFKEKIQELKAELLNTSDFRDYGQKIAESFIEGFNKMSEALEFERKKLGSIDTDSEFAFDKLITQEEITNSANKQTQIMQNLNNVMTKLANPANIEEYSKYMGQYQSYMKELKQSIIDYNALQDRMEEQAAQAITRSMQKFETKMAGFKSMQSLFDSLKNSLPKEPEYAMNRLELSARSVEATTRMLRELKAEWNSLSSKTPTNPKEAEAIANGLTSLADQIVQAEIKLRESQLNVYEDGLKQLFATYDKATAYFDRVIENTRTNIENLKLGYVETSRLIFPLETTDLGIDLEGLKKSEVEKKKSETEQLIAEETRRRELIHQIKATHWDRDIKQDYTNYDQMLKIGAQYMEQASKNLAQHLYGNTQQGQQAFDEINAIITKYNEALQKGITSSWELMFNELQSYVQQMQSIGQQMGVITDGVGGKVQSGKNAQGKNYTTTTVYNPNGSQSTGYVIKDSKGRPQTYLDPQGKTKLPNGSMVKHGDTYWRMNNGKGQKVGNQLPKPQGGTGRGVPASAQLPDGRQITVYIKNGVSYMADGSQVPNGTVVLAQNGKYYQKGKGQVNGFHHATMHGKDTQAQNKFNKHLSQNSIPQQRSYTQTAPDPINLDFKGNVEKSDWQKRQEQYDKWFMELNSVGLSEKTKKMVHSYKAEREIWDRQIKAEQDRIKALASNGVNMSKDVDKLLDAIDEQKLKDIDVQHKLQQDALDRKLELAEKIRDMAMKELQDAKASNNYEWIKQAADAVWKAEENLAKINKDISKTIVDDKYDTLFGIMDNKIKQLDRLSEQSSFIKQLNELVRPENYDEAVSGSQAHFNNLANRLSQLQKQREQVQHLLNKAATGSYEWFKIKEKLDGLDSEIRNSTIQTIEEKKRMVQLTLNRELQSIEQSMLGGRTIKEMRRERDLYVDGLEKELMLQQITNQIARDGLNLTAKQAELFNKRGKIRRIEIEQLNKELAIQKLQLDLEKLRVQTTKQVLTKTASGSIQFEYQADEEAIRSTEEQLLQAQVDLTNWIENSRLDEVANYLQDIRDKMEKALTGGYKNVEQLRNDLNSTSAHGINAGLVYDNLAKILGAFNEYLKTTYKLANVKPIQFNTGGYTGTFDGGKLAILHQKELVLNAQDTENLLKTIAMLNTHSNTNQSNSNSIEQVLIQANFPNVSSRAEIQAALTNGLVNQMRQKLAER